MDAAPYQSHALEKAEAQEPETFAEGLPEELTDLIWLGGVFSRLVAEAVEPPPARRPRKPRERSYVVGRDGQRRPVEFDRITSRNEDLGSNPAYGPELSIDYPPITADVIRRFRSGMTTRELDAETADICIQLATQNSDYDCLAARVLVSDLHKRTPSSMLETLEAISQAAPDDNYVRFSDEFMGVVRRASAEIDRRLDFTRDYRFRSFGFKTLQRSYLVRPACRPTDSVGDDFVTERPQHLYMRIALGLFMCQADGRGHLVPEPAFSRNLAGAFSLYDALSLQLVSNATPTILNAGTRVPQLSSCFQNATGDDLETLFRSVTTAAMCSKWSGGVSTWLHNVRAAGAPIRKTGGRSRGLGPYLRILNDVQLYADQGGNRPGAFAAYLSVDHADIMTFLAVGRPKGSEALQKYSAPDLKYALWVSDLFMETLQAQIDAEAAAAAGGTPDPTAGDWYLFSPDEAPGLHLVWGDEYRALYARYVAERRYRVRVKAGDVIAEAFKNWCQSGVPFVLFKDHINRKSNMKNVAPICSSNICVSADTRVLTEGGHKPISDLVNSEVRVWNGHEWSLVTVRQTGAASPLIRVEMDTGAKLDCTLAHKFYVQDGRGPPTEVRASALLPGQKLEVARWPVIEDGGEEPHAYSAGSFAADGALQKNLPAWVSPARFALSSLSSRLKWFAGLCDGNAYIEGNGEGELRVNSDNYDFLNEVRLMLQTMGCNSSIITESRPMCLRVAGDGLDQIRALAPPFRRVKLVPDLAGPLSVRVSRVTPLPGLHPTYCFTEPIRHRGVFNGILTGQCTETTMPSWSQFDVPDFARFHPGNAEGGEVGVCVLAAVCLEAFVCEPPGQLGDSSEEAGGASPARGHPTFDFPGVIAAAELEALALNRVIDNGFFPSPECRRGCQRHRYIGIGVLGLADALARQGLVYGTAEAQAFARGVAACVYYGALRASTHLAEIDGPYSTFEGSPISLGSLQPDLWVEAGDLGRGWEEQVSSATGGAITPDDWASLRAAARRGVRNAYVTAYMPTATTSNIVGQNECFEPFTSNVYTRKTLAGEFVLINRHLQADLIRRGLWCESLRCELLANSGSIQSIGRIPADIKRLYRTSREIHPSLFIRMAMAMAPFVCQSLSLNLFLDTPNLPRILRFLMEGWRAGAKTGLYYLHTRPSAGTQKTALKVNVPADRGTPAEGPGPASRPAQRGGDEEMVCDRKSGCTSCVL